MFRSILLTLEAIALLFFSVSCSTPDPEPVQPLFIDKTQNVLRQYADRQWPVVAGCYDEYAKSHAGSRGEIQFVHVINSDGTIERAEQVRNDLADSDAMAKCMLDQMKTWEYPRTGAKQRITIRYLFPPGDQ